jgi:hypothetical protein
MAQHILIVDIEAGEEAARAEINKRIEALEANAES